MFFRNLTFFRFPASVDFSGIDEGLHACRLKPVGPMEMRSSGFVSPLGREHEALSHRIGDALWLSVGSEEKILPAAAVNELAARKAAEIEEQEGRRLGGRARKRLKDDILHDLMPRALVRPGRTDAHFDLENGFVAIDTASRKTAEAVVSEVRHALGSFPALPLTTKLTPRGVLTSWVAGLGLCPPVRTLPDGLSLGDECELRDGADKGATVRFRSHELHGTEIREHLDAGKLVTRLALTLDDRLSFVLGEDLVIRKLKFLDGAVDQLDSDGHGSAEQELDARYALMAAELKRLFAVMQPALRFMPVEG